MKTRYSTETTLVIEDDGQRYYVATHPELGGCIADGATMEEAKANLDEAREAYLESLAEDGIKVPPPNLVRGLN